MIMKTAGSKINKNRNKKEIGPNSTVRKEREREVTRAEKQTEKTAPAHAFALHTCLLFFFSRSPRVRDN